MTNSRTTLEAVRTVQHAFYQESGKDYVSREAVVAKVAARLHISPDTVRKAMSMNSSCGK